MRCISFIYKVRFFRVSRSLRPPPKECAGCHGLRTLYMEFQLLLQFVKTSALELEVLIDGVDFSRAGFGIALDVVSLWACYYCVDVPCASPLSRCARLLPPSAPHIHTQTHTQTNAHSHSHIHTHTHTHTRTHTLSLSLSLSLSHTHKHKNLHTHTHTLTLRIHIFSCKYTRVRLASSRC